MSSVTLADNGSISEKLPSNESEAFVYVGLVDSAGADVAVDFGSGTVTIGKLADDGTNVIPLKTFTDLSDKDNRGSRFILPPNQTVVAILSGATTPNLYIEMQVGPRRNP